MHRRLPPPLLLTSPSHLCLPPLASANPSCSSGARPPSQLASFPSVRLCMRLDLHGDSEIMILHSGDEFDRLWKVDGSFFFFFLYIVDDFECAVEFWKISKKRRGRGDRRGSSFVFFCYTIDRTVELELLNCDRNINGKLYDASVSESSCTYHSWRAHALSRAGGYQHPPPPPLRTYAEFKVRGEFFERWCLASLSRFIDLPDISMLGPWSNPCRCES